jgi:hypothetical protein
MDKQLYKQTDIDIPILVVMGKKDEVFGIDEDHYKSYSAFDNYQVYICMNMVMLCHQSQIIKNMYKPL